MSWNGYENNVLLRNDGMSPSGTLSFTDVGMALGADTMKDGRGTAIADFDNDGDLDIVINSNPGDSGNPDLARATLLRNEVGASRNWLAVDLQAATGNRDAVGAVVTVETGGIRQMRHRAAGSSYASQHDARLHFGLGDASKAETLTVHWPSGATETYRNIKARQFLRITEGKEIEQVNPRP